MAAPVVASPSDTTMLDALVPAATALCAALDATAVMEARVGRASFLGPRSIGHQDPSANSTAIILASLARAVAAVDANAKLDDTNEEGARTWIRQ